MSLKLTLLLLTVAFLATTTYTQELEAPEQNEEFKCTHGEQEYVEPELLDVEEDWNAEGNNHEGRTLASYGQFRAKAYYGFLRSSVSYFQNDLIPPILDYFNAALKIKYPVSGLLKVTSGSQCGKSTPSTLRSGMNADYVLMIETEAGSGTWVASTMVCSSASGTRRPLVAHSKINTNKMKAQTSGNVLLHEKNMICMMHEITHSLGFTSNMYSSFLNANGQRQSGLVTSAKLAGYTSTVLTAEPLRTMLRNHFGCSSLKGAYMENTGGSGTTGHHFERRIFSGFEFMTSGLIYEMQVSKFTLGLLESTGWYVPNYAYAEELNWGKGQGCSFVTGSCSASSFSEFCSGSGRRCTDTGFSSGSCSSDSRSDGCKFIHPNVNYHCQSSSAKNSARLPSAESYGRSAGSRCFEGSLSSSSSSASTTAFCFKFSCSGSGSSTRLTVNVGSKSAVCTKAGSISVSGYNGKITCPNPQQFCSGAKKCPRGCMGRGTCNNGKCACRSGFKGIDCALRSSF